MENNENKLSFMLVLIDCSHLLFYIFTFITGGMLLLYNQIWIWECFCSLSKKKILLLQLAAIKIYVKHTVLQVLSFQRGQSYRSTSPIFFSESFILFGKLKLSIFVSTSYCINTVNLCFNFHQGLIKMLQKFCSV